MERDTLFLLIIGGWAVAATAAAVLLAARAARRSPESGLAVQLDRLGQEVRGLSELFLVPRSRGVVGETLLAELLASWLPRGSFEVQYGFANGARVDAVIRLGSKLVPVDSKFPLEAFARLVGLQDGGAEPAGTAAASSAGGALPAELRRTFERHVNDIAERYIRPQEGTMAFALMYIPSERIYVELFVDRPGELLAAAIARNVVPVSPGTLFLYLQTVAYGLRGLALPERTQRLLESIEALQGDLAAFTRSFSVAGTHLRNLSRAWDEAAGRLSRIELHAERLTRDE